MRTTLILIAFAVLTSPAFAGCEFATGPCSTDNNGNTYRTEQNLGGGYNTYRNGNLHSQTEQTLQGTYRESYVGGGYRDYNSNPYATARPRPYGQ